MNLLSFSKRFDYEKSFSIINKCLRAVASSTACICQRRSVFENSFHYKKRIQNVLGDHSFLSGGRGGGLRGSSV